MVQREIKYLQDIIQCISDINQYLHGRRQFSIFLSDKMLRDAIERNLITIGEAITRLKKINSEIDINSARQIINFRNYLTHSYDSVSEEIVWNIVINHLPLLEAESQNLIEQLTKHLKHI